MSAPTYGSSEPRHASHIPVRNMFSWAGEPDVGDAPRDGTILSSAMNLAACALGASMLSLPYAMEIGGPLATLGLLSLFAAMAFFAGQAVVNAGMRAKRSKYATIVHDAFGPGAGHVAEVLLSIALLVAGVSYICGLSDLIPILLPFTSVLTRTARILAVLVILFPVTLITSLAAFGPVSTIATVGCYIQVVAVFLELVNQTDPSDTWSFPPPSTLLKISLPGLVQVSPMVCFVFAYHYVLTETLDELSNPTPQRIRSVNLLTVGVLFGCYLPLAVFGYLNYSGENIPPNMLAKLNENSAAVLIARVVIAGLLFGTYSLFIIPLRRRVEDMVFRRVSLDPMDPQRLKVAGALAAIVAVVSVGLPDLSLANSVAGGCIALVMFFFPGLMMIHGQLGSRAPAVSDPMSVVVGILFVVAGCVVAVVGMFGSVLFDN